MQFFASKFALFTGLFALLDLGLLVLIYTSLPATAHLSESSQIHRSTFQGGFHERPIYLDGQNYVALKDLPQPLLQAVVLIEDARFYEHHGVDFMQILEALRQSAEEGRRLRGASTISQQLAKNLYLSSDRSLWRKFLEALITIKLELHLSKDRILEIYLNSIDWGQDLIGIQAASQHYFKKQASELNVFECVFLASILRNPAQFGKKPTHPSIEKNMNIALERLYRSGSINLEDYRLAVEAKNRWVAQP